MTAAILHRCGLAAAVFLPEDGAEHVAIRTRFLVKSQILKEPSKDPK
jgi:hypothetical protein